MRDRISDRSLAHQYLQLLGLFSIRNGRLEVLRAVCLRIEVSWIDTLSVGAEWFSGKQPVMPGYWKVACLARDGMNFR